MDFPDPVGGGSWQQQARIGATAAANGDLFGLSLSLLGERLAIAAPAAQLLRGRVALYERSGASWQAVAELGAAGGPRHGHLTEIDTPETPSFRRS